MEARVEGQERKRRRGGGGSVRGRQRHEPLQELAVGLGDLRGTPSLKVFVLRSDLGTVGSKCDERAVETMTAEVSGTRPMNHDVKVSVAEAYHWNQMRHTGRWKIWLWMYKRSKSHTLFSFGGRGVP